MHNQSEIAACTQINNIIDNTAPTITADATFYIDCEHSIPTPSTCYVRTRTPTR